MTSHIVVMGIVSWWTGLDPVVVAAVFTVLGGIALKFVEKWLAKNQDTRTEKLDLRAQMRELVDRLDKVEKEVDEWRSKYYQQQEHILVLKAMMLGAGLNPPDLKH